MRKIPTLFKREFDNDGNIVKVLPILAPPIGSLGTPTIKWDGACCAIINGKFYKRYDAKRGKKPPAAAIPCQPEPDPITSHWPHWVEVDSSSPADKWFVAAYNNYFKSNEFPRRNNTYEAIGRHFNGNPYELAYDTLIPHGINIIKDLELKETALPNSTLLKLETT